MQTASSSDAGSGNMATHGSGIMPGIDMAQVFDTLSTSLWMEDYSQLKALFDAWREQGVTNLREHLLGDTRLIEQCAQCIRVLRVNKHTLQLYGAASQEELMQRMGEVLRDDMLEAHLSELEQLWQGQGSFQSKTVNYSLDGRRLDLLLKGVVMPGHEQTWDQVLVLVDDITDLEEAHRRRAASEIYARGIFQYAPVSLWVQDFTAIRNLLEEVRQKGILDFRTFTDVHPEFVERCMAEVRVLDVNRYTLSMFKAASKAELLSRMNEVLRPDLEAQFRELLVELWEGKLFQQREVINYALDGTPINIHLQLSVFAGYESDWSLVLLALTDITARKKAELYLEYLGKHDVLTKLKNRSFFVDELARLKRKGPFPISAIAVDLNNLKETNDTLGHAAGDALLRRAGEVLSKAVDSPCEAARVGGDEFILLLPGMEAKQAQAICEVITQLVALNNQYHVGPALSLAMGTATCYDGNSLADMLREADMAMYEDKRAYYVLRDLPSHD